MEALLDLLTRPLSRGFKFVLMPILAFILIVLFVFLGFPYEVVADRAIQAVEVQTGATIRYGEVNPRLTIGGPGFQFREVDVILPDGTRYAVDPLRVRPAWSMGWLTGEPTLFTQLKSEHGDVLGELTLGGAFGWDGTVSNLDLSAVPINVGETIDLVGRADIDAQVIVRDGHPEGEIVFDALDGEIGHPAIPIPVEFDTAEGRIVLGGDHLAEIESLELIGPLLQVQVSGEIGHAANPGTEPLDISVDLTIREAGLLQMVRSMGLQLDPQGRAQLEIGGTLLAPELQ